MDLCDKVKDRAENETAPDARCSEVGGWAVAVNQALRDSVEEKLRGRLPGRGAPMGLIRIINEPQA